jgi:hypothetical protein
LYPAAALLSRTTAISEAVSSEPHPDSRGDFFAADAGTACEFVTMFARHQKKHIATKRKFCYAEWP